MCEVRILNAIIKMVSRGLISLKVLFSKDNKFKKPALFYIDVSASSHEITFKPKEEELSKQLKKIVGAVWETGKFFWRWKPKTCNPFEKKEIEDDTRMNDKVLTYQREIEEHGVLIKLRNEVEQALNFSELID